MLMELTLDIILIVMALLLAFVGFIGDILPGLPGTAFSYLALVAGACTSYSTISGWTLGVWFVVSVLVIVADFVFPALMTKAFGGTKYGTWGATIGIVAGFLIGNVFGLILGPFIGAMLGELIHDKQDAARALKVGFGSFMAFIFGTGLKLFASVWMLAILIADSWRMISNAWDGLWA